MNIPYISANLPIISSSIRILMLLRAIDVYDRLISERGEQQQQRQFYEQLFHMYSPPTLMEQLVACRASDAHEAEVCCYSWNM